MRNAIMFLISLTLSGCLFGATHGRTTTEYVNDDGIHPVQRTTVTQTSNGATVGGSVPLMINGGLVGSPYGAGGTIVGGGMGTVYGGGNTACVIHPDRCAAMQVATVYQPVSISSSGGVYGAYGATGVYAGHGQTSMVGPGAAGTYAEAGDDPALSAMLAKHEKALSKAIPNLRQTGRQICQILIANPEAITDKNERKDVIADCKASLAKHPYTPVKTAAAPAQAGEEK